MSNAYRDRIYETYATSFQGAPELFDVVAAERWGNAYDYYFRDWLPKDKDARVIEVACGGGRFLHFLKSRGFGEIAGVDISPQQVLLALQVIRDVQEGNAIEILEGHRSNYDLIVGLDIVEHFNKIEALRFLDACLTALRPGGRLILQTPNAESPWGSASRYGDFTHEIGFSPNAISTLLKFVGFRSIDVREMGPVPFGYSASSTIRAGGWALIRTGLKLWNLIEMGHPGSGVFTRVFLVSATR